MKPEDLLGKPIMLIPNSPEWYFIPNRISFHPLVGNYVFFGVTHHTDGRATRIVHKDWWGLDIGWIIAYDILARMEIDEELRK
jgi:hypothetical protein